MILLLAALAMQPTVATTVPIQARIVGIDERRNGVEASFDRVRVEFTNRGAVPVAMSVCPNDARFEEAHETRDGRTEWRVEGKAFATSLGGSRTWRTACRDVILTPGRAEVVNIFSRDDRTYGYARRLTLATGAGTFVFNPPERFATR